MAKKKAAPAAAAETPETSPSSGQATLSKHQKFEPRRIHRRDIQNADYNPRTIDDWAKKKLKRQLEKRGLLNALVWNERSGNLVSGHQRLAIMDALEGSDDYLIDIDLVKLTPKQEREANIAFNNASIQGQWDWGKLADVLKFPDVNIEDTGFDLTEVELMFEGTEWDTMFSQQKQAPEVARDLGVLEAMGQASRAAGREAGDGEADAGDDPDTDDGESEAYAGAPLPPDAEAPFGRLANGEAIRDPEAHAKLKEERERMRDRMAAAQEAKDPNFYVVSVFGNREEREGFMKGLGRDPEETMLDGRMLASKLGITLPKVTS